MDNYTPEFISQCQLALNSYGHCLIPIKLEKDLISMVADSKFEAIDHYYQKQTTPNASLFNILNLFTPCKEIEFIISLRSSENDWEEDGIWHDDGSRDLAFSLSLTRNIPKGGVLEIKKKDDNFSTYITTPKMGEMIVFKTGKDGYEHKINAVTKGSRLVIAGWCTN